MANEILRTLMQSPTETLAQQAAPQVAALNQVTQDAAANATQARLSALRNAGSLRAGFEKAAIGSAAGDQYQALLDAVQGQDPVAQAFAQQRINELQQQQAAVKSVGGLQNAWETGNMDDFAMETLGGAPVNLVPQVAAGLAGNLVAGRAGAILAGAYAGHDMNKGDVASQFYNDPTLQQQFYTNPDEIENRIGSTALMNTAVDVGPGLIASKMGGGLRNALTKQARPSTLLTTGGAALSEAIPETVQDLNTAGAIARAGGEQMQFDPWKMGESALGGAIQGGGVALPGAVVNTGVAALAEQEAQARQAALAKAREISASGKQGASNLLDAARRTGGDALYAGAEALDAAGQYVGEGVLNAGLNASAALDKVAGSAAAQKTVDVATGLYKWLGKGVVGAISAAQDETNRNIASQTGQVFKQLGRLASNDFTTAAEKITGFDLTDPEAVAQYVTYLNTNLADRKSIFESKYLQQQAALSDSMLRNYVRAHGRKPEHSDIMPMVEAMNDKEKRAVGEMLKHASIARKLAIQNGDDAAAIEMDNILNGTTPLFDPATKMDIQGAYEDQTLLAFGDRAYDIFKASGNFLREKAANVGQAALDATQGLQDVAGQALVKKNSQSAFSDDAQDLTDTGMGEELTNEEKYNAKLEEHEPGVRPVGPVNSPGRVLHPKTEIPRGKKMSLAQAAAHIRSKKMDFGGKDVVHMPFREGFALLSKSKTHRGMADSTDGIGKSALAWLVESKNAEAESLLTLANSLEEERVKATNDATPADREARAKKIAGLEEKVKESQRYLIALANAHAEASTTREPRDTTKLDAQEAEISRLNKAIYRAEGDMEARAPQHLQKKQRELGRQLSNRGLSEEERTSLKTQKQAVDDEIARKTGANMTPAERRAAREKITGLQQELTAAEDKLRKLKNDMGPEPDADAWMDNLTITVTRPNPTTNDNTGAPGIFPEERQAYASLNGAKVRGVPLIVDMSTKLDNITTQAMVARTLTGSGEGKAKYINRFAKALGSYMSDPRFKGLYIKGADGERKAIVETRPIEGFIESTKNENGTTSIKTKGGTITLPQDAKIQKKGDVPVSYTFTDYAAISPDQPIYLNGKTGESLLTWNDVIPASARKERALKAGPTTQLAQVIQDTVKHLNADIKAEYEKNPGMSYDEMLRNQLKIYEHKVGTDIAQPFLDKIELERAGDIDTQLKPSKFARGAERLVRPLEQVLPEVLQSPRFSFLLKPKEETTLRLVLRMTLLQQRMLPAAENTAKRRGIRTVVNKALNGEFKLLKTTKPSSKTDQAISKSNKAMQVSDEDLTPAYDTKPTPEQLAADKKRNAQRALEKNTDLSRALDLLADWGSKNETPAVQAIREAVRGIYGKDKEQFNAGSSAVYREIEDRAIQAIYEEETVDAPAEEENGMLEKALDGVDEATAFGDEYQRAQRAELREAKREAAQARYDRALEIGNARLASVLAQSIFFNTPYEEVAQGGVDVAAKQFMDKFEKETGHIDKIDYAGMEEAFRKNYGEKQDFYDQNGGKAAAQRKFAEAKQGANPDRNETSAQQAPDAKQRAKDAERVRQTEGELFNMGRITAENMEEIQPELADHLFASPAFRQKLRSMYAEGVNRAQQNLQPKATPEAENDIQGVKSNDEISKLFVRKKEAILNEVMSGMGFNSAQKMTREQRLSVIDAYNNRVKKALPGDKLVQDLQEWGDRHKAHMELLSQAKTADKTIAMTMYKRAVTFYRTLDPKSELAGLVAEEGKRFKKRLEELGVDTTPLRAKAVETSKNRANTIAQRAAAEREEMSELKQHMEGQVQEVGTPTAKKSELGQVPTGKMNRQAGGVDGVAEPITDPLAKIKADIERIAGPGVEAVMNRTAAQLGGSGSFTVKKLKSGQVLRTIELAIDAANPDAIVRHEALHAIWDGLDTTPETRRLLGSIDKNLRRMPVRLALIQRLAQHEMATGKSEADAIAAARKMINESPEELVAYAFQYWAEDAEFRDILRNKLPDDFPVIFRAFRAVADYIRGIIGVVSETEQTDKVFLAIQAGRLADPTTVNRALRQHAGQTLTEKAVELVGQDVANAVGKIYRTGAERVRSMNVPALNKLMDDLYIEVGEQGYRQDFVETRQRLTGQWMAQLGNILDDASSSEIEDALVELQNMQPASTPVAKQIRELLNALHDYVNTVPGAPAIAKIKNYFPRQWDQRAVARRAEEFTKLLIEEGDMEPSAAWAIVDDIQKGTGQIDLAENEHHMGYTPFMSAASKRILDFIDESNSYKFREFQHSDMGYILENYIRSAVHRTEYTRKFGPEGEKVAAAFKQALAEGATQDEVDEAARVVRSIEGTLNQGQMAPALQFAQSTLLTTLNMALLPLAIVSQTIDPLALAARSGSLRDAVDAYVEAVKMIPRSLSRNRVKDYHEDLAEMIGAIQRDVAAASLGAAAGGMDKYNRWMNQKYFHLNGMQAFNNAMRIAATRAGEKYLIRNHDKIGKIGELGLLPKDIMIDPATGHLVAHVMPGMSAAQQASVGRVQAALFRFVEQSVVHPNAGQQPVWMSDPKFQLLAHMKRFSYGMDKTIMQRARSEAELGNAKPFYTLLGALPVILAADMAKWATFGGDHTATWGATDYLTNAVNRAGLHGRTGAFISPMPGEGLFSIETPPAVNWGMSIAEGDAEKVARMTIPAGTVIGPGA